MGVNQSTEAEKRKIESIQIMNKDINKLRGLIGSPLSNDAQIIAPQQQYRHI